MKKIMLLGALIMCFASFTGEPGGVRIFFQNDTSQDFKTLKVNIEGKEFLFKNVKQGRKTGMIRVPESYRYCYAEAITTTKDTLIFHPVDYVGETLYTTGTLIMKFSLIPGEKKHMGIDSEVFGNDKIR